MLKRGTEIFPAASAIVPTFYFHLHNDIDARDEDGREFANLEAAREAARSNARFTFAETVKDFGRVNLDHRIDIEDADGRVLDTVRFRDVVEVIGCAQGSAGS